MDAKRLKKSEREVYQEAHKCLTGGATATEFSERFFGPRGRLRGLWRNESERRAVAASELFRWLQEQLAAIRRREAEAFERQVEALSGRLTVVVPRSLHAALKSEARLEAVSLSELIRLKLGVPYRSMTRLLTAVESGESAGRLEQRKGPARRPGRGQSR